MAARGTGHAHEGLGGAIVVGACLVVGVHLTTFPHSATHGFITLSVRPFSQLLKKLMPVWVESGMCCCQRGHRQASVAYSGYAAYTVIAAMPYAQSLTRLTGMAVSLMVSL